MRLLHATRMLPTRAAARPAAAGAAAVGLLGVLAACAGCAGNPPAPTGPVDVTAWRDGRPAAGMDVVFHDPAGGVLAHVVTGSSGHARFDAPAMAIATVAWVDSAGTHRLDTAAGLVPGEAVTLGERTPPFSGIVGQLNVSFPAHPDAAGYYIDFPCGAAATTVMQLQIPVPRGCDDAGTADIAVTAHDGAGNPVAWTAAFDLPLDPAVLTTATLSEWFDALPQTVVTISSLPPHETATVGMETLLDRSVSVQSGGILGSPLEPGDFTFARLEQGRRRALQTTIRLARSGGTSAIWQRTQATPPATLSVDGATALLPAPGISADLSAPSRPRVTWQVPEHDGLSVARVGIEARWPAAGDVLRWSVRGPPQPAGSFRFPALPDALEAFRPPTAAGGIADLDVDATEANEAEGDFLFRRASASVPL